MLAGLSCSGFVPLASWVIGAKMPGKFFFALQLEIAPHFVER
jgi:hypothetical protein